MKDLVKKVAVGLSTAALLTNMTALPAFGLEVVVSGNGSDSYNDVEVNKTNATVVEQDNHADISNEVEANASTGGNEANDNTGGAVSIDTGKAQTAVEVTNVANSNEALVECGSCPTDVHALISGNGSESKNDIDVNLTNETFVTQDNDARIYNDVDANAKTGYNEAEDNTGGDVSIDTGKAVSVADVQNKVNANVAKVANGDGQGGALDLVIVGNGADSHNYLDANLANAVVLDQNNWAGIYNDVEVDALTGHNEADDNTGGIVSIDTGEAVAGAFVDNMANFNAAFVEDCCEFDGLIKIAGNGSDSKSDVDFYFDNLLASDQDNGYKQRNDVDANAKTGYNEIEDSTGSVYGDPSIDTGSASTEVDVASTGNSNVFSTGDGLHDSPSWWDSLSESHGDMFVWWMAMMHHQEG